MVQWARAPPGPRKDVILTPIKVRGKKRNRTYFDQEDDVEAARQGLDFQRDNNDDMNSIPAPKAALVKLDSAIQAVRRRRVKNIKRNTLESMPMEILEQIFFECLEINLLHVLPWITQAVSRERIYFCITTLAIWNDPGPKDMNDETMDEPTKDLFKLGEKEILKAFRPIGYRHMSMEEKKRLQRQILNCRWATFEFIRSCVVKCADLTRLRVKGYEAKPERPDLTSILDILEAELRRNYLRNLNLKDFNAPSKCPGHCPIATYSFSHRTPTPAYILTIPNKAIDGSPWTYEKIEYFKLSRVLLYSGKDPKPSQPFSRDLLHEGVHQAIVQQNITMVQRLLELDEYCVRSTEFIFQGVPRNSAYEIPPGHFITATRTTNAEMFQTLIRASAESLPYDSPEITQWALTKTLIPVQFSEWLLDFMVQLPSYQKIHSSDQSLFVCGMLNLDTLTSSYDDRRLFNIPGASLYTSNEPIYEDYKRLWGAEPCTWILQLLTYVGRFI
ncbi:hypothetical protein FQN49_001776 [Arthroderma sp. PD_2]|nr:hypothetical protein FQN49_001776 [Arthroderma sp. PD_2]